MTKQFAVLNGSINIHILFGFYVHLTLTGMITKIFPIYVPENSAQISLLTENVQY